MGYRVQMSDEEIYIPEQRQMQQDSERACIRRENNQLRSTAIERLGRFVGTLFQLLVVRSLLNDIKDVLGEGFVGDGPGCREFL